MNYAVAAGHDATADTAVEILKAGGNAFDAAIAAYLTAFIAEPCMASGGGGAFANVYTASGERLLFDFFCQTPKSKQLSAAIDFQPIEVDFGDTTEVFYTGKGSTGVPGSIAGIFAIHEKLGTMPMSELVKIPIQYAKEGIAINDFQALDLSLLEEIFRMHPRSLELFFREDGTRKQIGDVVQMPGLADFLDYMAREGQAAFYQGEIARKIVEDYQHGGGYLTMTDFKDYKVEIREPLAFPFRQKTVLTNPLPSIGGTLLCLMLLELGENAPQQLPQGEEHILQWYRAQREVSKLSRLPEDLRLSLQQVLQRNKKHGSTSHFNIVDQWGNAISLTMTIGEGCGYFVEGTDIHMNNMLGEAALLPHGFHTWDEDVRLSSMMSPTIVLNAGGKAEVVLGSGGASRIATAIAQVIHLLLDYQLPVHEAVNLSRVHLGHDVFNIEKGFNHQLSPDLFEGTLKAWNNQSLFFGGVHTILRHADGRLMASGDDRRDGVVRVG